MTSTRLQPSPDTRTGTDGVLAVAALGVVLTVYSFLAALWPVRHGAEPAYVAAVREWLWYPLGVGEDAGVLGQGLLLFALGHTIAASRPRQLPAKLLLGGYLPYAIAVSVAELALLAGVEPLSDPPRPEHHAPTLVQNLLLLDRMLPADAVLIVSGSMAAAALYVLVHLCTAAVPSALVGVVIQAIVLGAIAILGTFASGWVAALGGVATFALLPVLGALVYGVRRDDPQKAIATPVVVVVFLATWLTADIGYATFDGWAYALTAVYVGIIGSLLVTRAAPNAAIHWLGSRSYVITLAACAVGYPILGALADVGLPFGAALPIALAVTGVLAEAAHRLISPRVVPS